MSESLNRRVVVAVASTALFDLTEADAIFRADGVGQYRAYQRDHEQVPLGLGSAFPLVRRLLGLNRRLPGGEAGVEVVLLSRNDPDSGLRILNSIAAHGLPMSRALFVSGRSPYRYAQAMNASLFLSTNLGDVREALSCGVPAGRVCPHGVEDDAADSELRIAFDFDGVLADDTSEQLYQSDGLEVFQRNEHDRAHEPLADGPLARFCRELSQLQQAIAHSPSAGAAVPPIRTSIVTSRGAPAHTRVVTTLRSWGIAVDEAFFLGGLPKSATLAELKPHIFFDDQLQHISGAADCTPCAHVPFGVANGGSAGWTATTLQ
ncbi:MAG: 5'-nucleotidase [Vicinamibacterales bacterium]